MGQIVTAATMGIAIGSDSHQEWLLPWWWEHYSRYNNYPVAIFDFGMSSKALAWCKEKGTVLSLSESIPLQPLTPHIAKHYKDRTELDHFRAAWFKKPLALSHSPFPLCCWIDLDCEVKTSLEPLFNTLYFGADIALVKEPDPVQEKNREFELSLLGEIAYNAGVIAFKQNSPILHQWIQLSTTNNGEFLSDQDALSRAIHLNHPPLFELPPTFNWKITQGPSNAALILHYAGSAKSKIKHFLID